MASRAEQQPAHRVNGDRLTTEAARFFAEVYEPARRGCMKELRDAGCSEAEAEDIFSATFQSVLEKVDPIGRSFAKPQMVNLLKKASRRRLIDERRHQTVLRQVELSEVRSLADSSAESPDEVAVEREVLNIGREAVLTLPQRERMVFHQRHQLKLTPQEIQKRVPGLTPRSYRKIIERANTQVLEAFERIDRGERCEDMERTLLRRFVAKAMQEEERESVEAHLQHCRACQRAAARMRGYLHDVAGSLAVVTTLAQGEPGRLAAAHYQLQDLVAQAGQGIGDATRDLRERARDVLIRISGNVPGPGGDVALGQVVGASGVKAVCAGGTVAAYCIAAVAGVAPVPQLDSGDQSPSRSRDAVDPAHVRPIETLAQEIEPVLPTQRRRPLNAARAEQRAHAADGKRDTRDTEGTFPPVASGEQTGEEFGFETGAPSQSTSTSSSSESISGSQPAGSESGSEAPSGGSGGGAPAGGGSGGDFGF